MRCCVQVTTFLEEVMQDHSREESSFEAPCLCPQRMVVAAANLGDLREEDFHLSSSHFGFRSDGPRRRNFGYPGSGQAVA